MTSPSLPLKTLLESNRRLTALLDAKVAEIEALQVKYDDAMEQVQSLQRKHLGTGGGGNGSNGSSTQQSSASPRRSQQQQPRATPDDHDETTRKQLLRFAERQMALLQKNSELEDQLLLLENENAQIKIQLVYFSNQYMQFRRALEAKFDSAKARSLLRETKEADDLRLLFNALSITAPSRQQQQQLQQGSAAGAARLDGGGGGSGGLKRSVSTTTM